MSLDGRCEIEPCLEPADHTKMARACELVKIDALARKIGTRGSVDVHGGQASANSALFGANPITRFRRDVVLVDDTNKTVTLTLWNALAVEQAHSSRRWRTRSSPCAVARHGQRRLVVHRRALGLFVSPDAADIADRVVRRAASTRRLKPSRRAPVRHRARPAAPGLARAAHGLMSIPARLLPPSTAPAAMSLVTATACLIKADRPCTTTACPRRATTRRLSRRTASGTRGRQKTYDTCRRQYILRMKIQDHSGMSWVNVFHEQACEMLGVDAERCAMRESDPAAYERAVKRAQFPTGT